MRKALRLDSNKYLPIKDFKRKRSTIIRAAIGQFFEPSASHSKIGQGDAAVRPADTNQNNILI